MKYQKEAFYVVSFIASYFLENILYNEINLHNEENSL